MVRKVRDGFVLAAVTAATIAVAGILHLEIAYELMAVSTLATGIFVIFGIPQLAWIIPTIQKWEPSGTQHHTG
jgi:hypothetical protein